MLCTLLGLSGAGYVAAAALQTWVTGIVGATLSAAYILPGMGIIAGCWCVDRTITCCTDPDSDEEG
jgi:hypothetical protein